MTKFLYDEIFVSKKFIFYINYILNMASFDVVNVSFLLPPFCQ